MCLRKWGRELDRLYIKNHSGERERNKRLLKWITFRKYEMVLRILQ
jgi:hypothetical protein